jgi:hypothetical protein
VLFQLECDGDREVWGGSPDVGECRWKIHDKGPAEEWRAAKCCHFGNLRFGFVRRERALRGV